MINVLFLGGGRRYSLFELFKNNGFKIFSYELNKEVPVSLNSNIIIGKKWSDSMIENDIIEAIKKNKIHLVIPLQDEGIVVCSKLKEKFKNSDFPIFLSSGIIPSEICFNKKLFEDFMIVNFLEIYPKDNNIFPKFSKPIFGFSSREINILKNLEDESHIDKTKFIIQRKISGLEYSVDAYFDKKSNFVDAVIRERVRIAGGEVITSKTLYNDKLYKISKNIGEKLELIGPVCFQYIIENDEPYIIEINARFGGGVVLSIEAGLDFLSLIKKDYFNYDFSYQPKTWKKNLLMERYYKETFFNL